jgi:hypothetical protein
MSTRTWFGRVAAGIGTFFVAALALALIVMLLWNVLVPEVFRGPELTYVQSLELLILAHLLLRGWSPWRYRDGWRQDRWKRRFEEKMAAMAPEEREKFRQEWHRRCPTGPEASAQPKES